ncbi:4-hydroxybenzoate solanesyltransferase [Leptolyngbya sp. FACHB-261]|uniref:4-hydroxybenzoate solanesyltransferase n=1 Tax=Leptolyngbya sp. FACHB-261 TaxID=2692806 RepID=UPI00168752F6|nr:4-hydroxybenzoate solanesyltransferase [Leptolyngbya sp. FACHB-261]MBD2104999.1 4-hydroxybenzoate solanesyltransferase [Leptolyngbya sp. FACHB-261]
MSSTTSTPIWQVIFRLLRWDKPAGRLILMLPALWAVVLAAHSLGQCGRLPPVLVGVVIVGTLATSAAGCVVNDLWDRNIDPQVERTRNRPLASRALSVRVGLVVAVVAFLCAWGLAAYLHPLSYALCVAAVPVIVLYPLAKRVFPIPQLVLSLAWGFAVLISWSAVTGALSPAAWLLWAATVLWTLGFDTIYAMADREDDRRIGVKSSALFFGKFVTQAIGAFLAGTVILLLLTGINLGLSWPFFLTTVVATGLWILQYRQLLGRNLSRADYGRLFAQNVWIGFLLLAGMEIGALLAC